MKKILIFSNGEKMGDALIKLPIIYEIFFQFTNCNLTWLAYGTTVYSTTLKKMSSKYIYNVMDNAELQILPWKKISQTEFSSEFWQIPISFWR